MNENIPLYGIISMCIHIIPADPLTCGEISRAAF